MTPQHDILDELKAALEIEPSASFEARVRRRVASASVTWGPRMRLAQLAVTSVAVLGIATVWFGWARSDGSIQSLPDSGVTIASRVPAAPVVPTRVASAPSAQRPAPDPERRTPSAERPAPTPGVGNTAAPFDAFRDVVIPPADVRAMAKLIERIESGPLPAELQRALEFDNDDVRVMALNELAPIAIAPIGGTRDGDAPADVPR